MPIIRYDIQGESDDLVRATHEASKALKSLDTTATKTKRKVDALTGAKKSAAKESVNLKDKLEGTKRIADGLGGVFGEKAGQIENFTQAAVALGPAAVAGGVAIAGIGIAAAGIASVVFKTIQAIDEITAGLKELGLQPGITDTQLASIKSAKVSFQAVEVAITQAALALAGELAPDAESAADALTTLIGNLTRMIATGVKIARWAGWALDLTKKLLVLPWLAEKVTNAVIAMTGVWEKDTKAIKDQINAYKKLTKFQQAMIDYERGREKSAEKAKAAAVKKAEEDKERYEAWLKREADREAKQKAALARDLRMANEATEGAFAAEDAEQEKLRQTQILDAELAEKRKETALDLAKTHAAIQKEGLAAQREISQTQKELSRDQAGAVVDSVGNMAEAWSNLADLRLTQIQKELKQQKRALKKSRGMTGETAKFNREVIKARVEDLQKAQRRQFAIQKSAAIAGIIIDVAKAIVAAQWLLPPASIILSTTIAALGATQIAAVVAQKPTFHLGAGQVTTGEVAATLRTGEAVLTPAAADSIGRENIEAANRGAGGPMTVTINQVWDNRILDTMVAEVIRAGGAAGEAVQQLARRAALDTVPSYGGT